MFVCDRRHQLWRFCEEVAHLDSSWYNDFSQSPKRKVRQWPTRSRTPAATIGSRVTPTCRAWATPSSATPIARSRTGALAGFSSRTSTRSWTSPALFFSLWIEQMFGWIRRRQMWRFYEFKILYWLQCTFMVKLKDWGIVDGRKILPHAHDKIKRKAANGSRMAASGPETAITGWTVPNQRWTVNLGFSVVFVGG